MKMFIKRINEIEANENYLVGGKAVNLSRLSKANFPVPPAFYITTNAFKEYVSSSQLEKISTHTVKPFSHLQLLNIVRRIKQQLRQKPISLTIEKEVLGAYHSLLDKIGKDSFIVVRSSATSEDLKKLSFAGQFDTFLAVQGDNDLIVKIKACWMSLFNDRLVSYSYKNQFDFSQIMVGVIVQKMIDCEKAGIMFTVHPVTREQSKVVVEANWGLGEAVVSGKISPDSYIVDKGNLRIIEQNIANKKWKSTLINGKIKKTKIPKTEQNTPCLKSKEITQLVKLAINIENLFKFPQDIEWGIAKNNIYIFQSRPITSL